MNHKNVQIRKINKNLENIHLMTFDFHFVSKFIATGSLSLSAINLDA